MKQTFRKKVLVLVSIISIIAQSLSPFVAVLPQAYAQEVTPTPTVDQTTPTVTPTPTDTTTVTPTPTVDQATPTPIQSGPTDVPVETITPTPTDTLTPTDTPTVNNNSPPSNDQQVQGASTSPTTTVEPTTSPTSTIDATPTTTPLAENSKDELLNLVILSNVSAPTIDLGAVAESGSAILTTDKPDYAPTDTALITGSNLIPNTTYTLKVWSDNPPPTGVSAQVTSDDKGVLVYAYQLDGTYRPNYSAELKDSSGVVVATVTFTDGPLGKDFKQCANQDPTLGSCHWIGSALQGTNSAYSEGMSVPQRLLLTDIPATAGNVHTLTFSHQATKGGVHAYDFLTAYNQGNSPALTLNACNDFGGSDGATCNTLRGGANTIMVDAPNDAFISKDGSTQTRINNYELAYGNRQIKIYGSASISIGSFSSISHDVANNGDANDSYVLYALTWTSSSTNILIEMAGHLSTSADWGTNLGAGSVSGGPYHFKLDQLDGSSLGSQDNQIQASALISPATITVNKILSPSGDSGKFDLKIDGSTAGTGGNVGNNGTTGAITVSTTGTHIVSETGNNTNLSNYTTTYSCNNNLSGSGTSVPSFSVTAGQNVVCTFTNTVRNGTIIVKKTMVGGTGTFNFTGDVAGSISANNGTLTTSNVLPGTYTSVESGATGWDLTNLSCSDSDSTVNTGTRTATFNVSAGETVTCTFTNTKKPKLTIVKVTDPTADTGKFNLSINGTEYATDISNEGNTGAQFANIGSNTFAESAGTSTSLSNYTSVVSGTGCGGTATAGTITLAAGDDKTCTITNTKKATIIVKKIMVGGTDTFSFTGTPNGSISTSGNTIQTSVVPGQYISAETPLPGWDVTSVVCDDRNSVGSVSNHNATFNAEAGETVTCTFTNTKLPKLTVTKVLSPSNDPGLFNLQINSQTYATNISNGGTTGAQTANVGSNTIGETAGTNTNLSNYAVAYGGDCNSNTITLAAGDNKNCTITNTRKQGTIELNKVWSGTGGQVTLRIGSTVDGTDVANLTTGANGADPLTTGQKTVNEETYYANETGLLASYTPSALSCFNDADNNGVKNDNESTVSVGASNAVAVGNGEHVICSFTNTRNQGTIELKKVWIGTPGSTTLNIGTSAGGSQIDTQAVNGADDTTGANIVDTNTYFVSETGGLDNYTSALNCVKNGNTNLTIGQDNSVVVGNGDAVVCTFTNTRQTGDLIVHKMVDRIGDGSYVSGDDSEFAWGFSSTPSNNTYNFGDSKTLNTGPYSVYENNVPGYKFIGWFRGEGTCNNEELNSTLPANVSVNNDRTTDITLCNKSEAPKLTISKTNNAVGNKAPGDVVTYTLTVTASRDGGPIDNVKVTDLLPNGFKYNGGSWQAFLNDVLNGAITQPTYHSPGVWTLGHMNPGDTYKLVYTATIDGGQAAGTYYDNAWAVGNPVGDSATQVFAKAFGDGDLDTLDPNSEFVGTEVAIANGQPGVDYKLTQAVLGASIGPELPSTGENTWYVIIASLLGGLGLGSLILGFRLRRRYEK